jgi:hypothetical protein
VSPSLLGQVAPAPLRSVADVADVADVVKASAFVLAATFLALFGAFSFGLFG